MKISAIQLSLITLSLSGCFTHMDEIQSKLPSDWTSRECLTVMLANMKHNLNDPAFNIQAIVTPYFPSVIEAITRLQQFRSSNDSEAIRIWQNALLKSGMGLYIDWEQGNRLVNAYGNYYRDPRELDSMLFLVTLRNKSWPCNVPVQNVLLPDGIYVSRPIAALSDWPCYIPDITDLDQRIFLVNEAGDSLKAKFTWGRNNNQLSLEENIFVMFDFHSRPSLNFFKNGTLVNFVITGFDLPISFKFLFDHIQ